MALTLSDVLSVASVATWEAQILAWANTLGLPATSWQSGGVARTIIAVMSNAMNASDQTSVEIASSGFLDTSAAITPEGGPGWLDTVAWYVYGVERNPATAGTTSVVITNPGAAIGPLAAGTYHVQVTSTGHTYANSATVTLGTGTTTIALVCDDTGLLDTSGSLTTPITAYPGVTSGTLISGAVGSQSEDNASLVSRCRNKMAALAPKLGNASSYQYFALSTSEPGYPAVSSPITRVSINADKYSGAVVVTIANTSGAPPSGDVALMQTWLDAVATPDAESLTVQPAGTLTVNVSMSVYCPAVYSTQVVTDVQAAITQYLQTLPIGGNAIEGGQGVLFGVPFNELEDYVARKVPYLRTQITQLNGQPIGESVTLTYGQVAIAGTIGVAWSGT